MIFQCQIHDGRSPFRQVSELTGYMCKIQMLLFVKVRVKPLCLIHDVSCSKFSKILILEGFRIESII